MPCFIMQSTFKFFFSSAQTHFWKRGETISIIVAVKGFYYKQIQFLIQSAEF